MAIGTGRRTEAATEAATGAATEATREGWHLGQGGAQGTEDEHYLLKLCLELQVETLLLTLGSSAVVSADDDVVESGSRPSRWPGHPHPRSHLDSEGGGTGVAVDGGVGHAAKEAPIHAELPWGRWMSEDLELAWGLARACAGGGVALPASMGLPCRSQGFAASKLAIAALEARFTALQSVLQEMLRRSPPWESRVIDRLALAYGRCTERLDELHRLGAGGAPSVIDERGAWQQEPGHYLG